MTKCLICLRETEVTRHHLYPKTLHKRLRKKKYDKNLILETIDLCRPCHSYIHKMITEKEMANEYNTLEKIINHDKIKSWIEWIRTKNKNFKPKKTKV